MHYPDDKQPTQAGFEISTSEFRTTTGPNEPSGPALSKGIGWLRITMQGYCNAEPLYLADSEQI